jgi:hypothetical protein
VGRMIGRMIDYCFAVAGAVLLCQFPLFIQQYMLLLTGHLSESRLQFKVLEETAAMSNKTVAEYIHKFAMSPDLDFIHQAQWMQSIQTRAESLGQAYATLQEASIWSKPFVFLFHFDRSIFAETVHAFSFGLPMTLEGLIYAICGIGLGAFCYRLLQRGLFAFVKLFKRA